MVVDIQRGVVADAFDVTGVVDRIKALVERARQAGTLVVWVRHSSDTMPEDSDGWQIVPALTTAPGEPVIGKRYGDSFEDTDLETVLSHNQIGHLVVCGAQSDACVISTLFGAFVRGYNVTLAADAHTTDDRTPYGGSTAQAVITTVNQIWAYRGAPGRSAAVAASDRVVF